MYKICNRQTNKQMYNKQTNYRRTTKQAKSSMEGRQEN